VRIKKSFVITHIKVLYVGVDLLGSNAVWIPTFRKHLKVNGRHEMLLELIVFI
jgi:hypothetical protein